jgi:hypothetical protein
MVRIDIMVPAAINGGMPFVEAENETQRFDGTVVLFPLSAATEYAALLI